jgi:hypothetical protein
VKFGIAEADTGNPDVTMAVIERTVDLAEPELLPTLKDKDALQRDGNDLQRDCDAVGTRQRQPGSTLMSMPIGCKG